MFPFTLQTPTRHPCLSFFLHLCLTHTHTHVLTSVCAHTFTPRCESTTPLPRCKSGVDMRGSAGKLVFRRKRTGQVGSALKHTPLNLRDKLHRRRTAAYGGAVTSPLISQHEEGAGIKVRRCQASTREEGNYPAVRRGDRKSITAFGLLTKGICHHCVVLFTLHYMLRAKLLLLSP